MEQLEFPKEIMIEATNYCNCRCFFCSSTVTNRTKGHIDRELAIRLIIRAYELGTRKISFHCMGEPFLSPNLKDFIKMSKNLGYTYIYLDTNGVVATPEKLNPVLDAGLDSLKFSIHAATAETHRLITNTDGFERVVNNFKKARKYIDENKISCKLIAYFAESKINVHEKENFKKMFGPYADEIWIRPIHNGSGANLKNKDYICECEKEIQSIPCKELYNRMIIDWRGRAIACCTDWTERLIYGDANEKDLLELWNNEQIWQIRGKHNSYETLPGICKRCLKGFSS